MLPRPAASGLLRFLPLPALALASAFVCLGTAAWAGPASPPAELGNDVRGWLMRIHEAASQRNFHGTFVVSGGGQVSSARIAHYCEGSNQFERIDALDGQPRHVFRYNERVHVVWPERRMALVEQRLLPASFPALLQSGDDRIAELYDLRRQPAERIAGHEAHVLQVVPKDADRYGYRLWADKASGLLLRADVLDERETVIETSAFSEVSIGVRPQLDQVRLPAKKLDGYRVLTTQLTPTRPEDQGWALNPAVNGFRMVSCVQRPLDPEAPDGRSEPVLQTIFSDGLTHVSLFIEPFNASRHARPMLTSVGATRTLMRRQGDWWITVIGDVPASTLKRFAAGVERKR